MADIPTLKAPAKRTSASNKRDPTFFMTMQNLDRYQSNVAL